MGYDQLYEGGSGWQKYSWQQNTGFAAGFDGGDVLMGMPAWDATHDQWGTSSGRGTSAQAHVKEVRYDLNGSTGIAIWDMQFNGWDDPDLWCEIKELKGTSTQNAAPLAADDEVSGSEDSVIMLDVLANDSDADGDPLIIISLTGATYGTAVIEGATVRYTPNLDFNGSDSFGYTIADGNGGVASATIFVTVTAVNDLPVANDDSASTRGTDAVTIDVIANDSDVDGDSLTITGTSVPTHGAVSHTGTSISYIADESFSGNDSFIYTVSDGAATASATVTVAVAGTQLVSVDSLSGAASGGKKRWNASVTTRVSPPLAGVTIQGNWSIGGAHSCVTDGDGRCSGSVSLREGSVTYSVTALGGEGFEYHAGLNEMPEITVHKDGSVGYPGINQQPGADFSHSADGLNVQFTDTSTDLDGSIISRLWNFGNGNTSTAQHPAHDYEQAGTYTVTLTVNDDGGESDSMSHSVVVSGEPPADMAVHLGELSATVSGNKRWTTTVTIPVHTGGESGKAGVTASGSWSDGASGSCQTDLNGVCSLSRSTKAGSMVFTLNGLAGNGVDYQFESNHGNVTITTVKP